ncbi:MAG: hypothetical protein HQL78_07845, partial [Magnetococcales bacterium]|nr:hypothetical protein [Magnetococcales bacterium]
MIRTSSYLSKLPRTNYYIRISVPHDLVDHCQCREFRRSLRTSCRREAIDRARRLRVLMDRLFMEMREKKVNWADAKKMLADELLWLTDEFKRHIEENGPADKLSLPFFTDFMLRDREKGDAVLQEYELARAKETPHLDYIFSLGLKACQIAERNGVDLLKADAATRQRFSDATERMLQEFHSRATNINDQELQGFRMPGGEIQGPPVPAVTPGVSPSGILPAPHLSAPQSGIAQDPQAVNSPLLSEVI